MGPQGPPEPLAPRHDISRFSSGVPTPDAWLRGRVRLREARGGARTCDRVAGFHSHGARSVARRRASSRVGRGMPDPVNLLGQVAGDEHYRARRLGSDLPLAAASVVGARAIVVPAIDERAAAFHAKFGFRPFSAREPLMRVLRMSELEGLLRA